MSQQHDSHSSTLKKRRWHGRPVAKADSQNKGPKARSPGKTPEDHQFSTTFSVVELWLKINSEKYVTYLFPKFVPFVPHFLQRRFSVLIRTPNTTRTAMTASIKKKFLETNLKLRCQHDPRNWQPQFNFEKKALAWPKGCQS